MADGRQWERHFHYEFSQFYILYYIFEHVNIFRIEKKK